MRTVLFGAALLFLACPSPPTDDDGGTGGGSAATGGGGSMSVDGGATGGGISTGGGGGGGGGGSMVVDAGSDAGTNPTDAGTVYLADPQTTGHELHVCATGCAYSKPSEAVAASVDGDTIVIEAGSYDDCAVITKNHLVIRGVKNGAQRPQVGPKVCGRKGIFVVQSHDVLFESLELHGAIDTVGADLNWAAVRLDATPNTGNVQFRDLFIHDCDDGILGPDTAKHPNVFVVERSTFQKLGRDGYAHGMYIGADADLFVFRNSVVSDNANDGHLLKSRARHSIVECSTVASLNGANSYALDFPNGGTVEVRDSVIEQGPHLNNGQNLFVNFAGENGNSAPHALVLQRNVLVNDYANVGRVKAGAAGSSVVTTGWSGNSYASTSDLVFDGLSNPGGVTRVTRAVAFDGTLASLPAAPQCP